ncbi:uncharacterized protein PFL1_02491 [Pseudozyma flocculosa PF-1]|uniref:Related to NMD2 - Nonsense-mediated mRNA decay protein 2 n=2 Tax=Pseudozyma flocculosa TaxID=84751 RepID=A0A5C3EZ51_9BASI|nr:uncharacterized protein PFL1_02491 [Pseudozyma flocculosa PF-1]EPQ29818.1 hypothetical protein PFL1_02491 [Pseudozyma flocculosa PF-1]SPO37110.1 related to NMD2 - Nonsense-mediated mRNA decay protein 2 [Pseudozyma flocculosa]
MSARSQPTAANPSAANPSSSTANSNQSSAAATPSIAASNIPTAPAKDDAAAAQHASQQLFRDRQRRRQQLRAANLAAWSAGPSIPSSSLDSNLKKNTAFIKRVKQSLAQDARDQLIRDLGTLSLDKYREEIVQAVPEGLQKCINPKDCMAAAEILSAFHCRFGGDAFSAPLTSILSATLAPPNKLALQSIPQEQRERDEAARVARQKQLLRVAADLALVEVVGHSKDQSSAVWLYQVTKELLATDKDHVNVPILITLLRALAPALVDPPSTADAGTSADPEGIAKGVSAISLQDAAGAAGAVAELDAADPEAAPLVTTEMKAKFRKLFETYFATLSRKIVKEHERLQEQDRRNHEAYIRYGEIFEDRQQTYEKMTKGFERYHEWGKLLSDLLGVPMPKLVDAAKSNAIGLGVNLDSKSALFNERSDEDFGSNQSPWEDEDTRRFYEDLLDLSDVIPPSVLAGTSSSTASASKDTDGDASARDGQDPASPDPSRSPRPVSDGEDASEGAVGTTSGADAASEDQMNAGPAAQLNSLLAKLPDLTNRAMIDSAAVDFAFLASKPARRKLVKHLSSIPRSRLDLIPYYARLAATLNRYMPDVGSGLVGTLDDEFRYFQRKKNVELTESRAKNARFLAELTKFKVTPSHTIFHCLKVCLEDFSGPNIDVLATLLETCGRYLLRTEESSAKMRSMLEMLRRKRGLVNLDARQLLMLDNAYYQCNPPERKAIEQKVRSPMELFVRHLVYDVLTKKTLDKVLKLLRKLHWEDPTTVDTLKALFTRVWKMKFSNIHLLAILVYDLQAYHLAFTVDVIDQVLENIRTGLEQNIFKHNQRRVATVRYLGELYNYRLINSGIVFDQLWSLTTFGHPGGRPLPGQVTPIDAPDDYFRIRLICTLLDTCGMCFDRGSLKKKLDEFLVFLNLYVLSKERPLPMEVDFMLSDTLESLRPKFQLKTDFAEAALEVDLMLAAHRASNPASGSGAEGAGDGDYDDEFDEDEDEDDDSDDDDDDDDGRSGDESRRGPKMRNGGDSTGVSQLGDDDFDDDDEDDDDAINDFSEGGSHLGRDTDAEEDEAMVRRREEEATIKREADDEFDRELAKMMSESGSSVGIKTQNRGLSDVGIPMIRSRRASQSSAYASKSDRSDRELGTGTSGDDDDDDDDDDEGQHMRFSLLSKKGNKQTTHEVKVPATSAIAINTRTKQLKNEAERRQLKELVLAYEGREEEADRRSLEQTLSRRGFKVKFADEQRG